MEIITNRNNTGPSRLVLAKIFLGAAVLCLVLSLAAGAYLLFIPASSSAHTATKTNPKTHQKSSAPQLTTAQLDQQAASSVSKTYLNALLQGQYNTMWTQLHPDIQAIWQNEGNFESYWKARFQDYSLQTFTLSAAKPTDYWINPETMIRYNHVEELTSSLQLTPKSDTTNQPPENVNPGTLLQNLPFIVQKSATGNQWQVVVGGPADLEAPMTLPFHPIMHQVQVPILMYHHITDVPTTNLLDFSLTVTPSNFGQQLDYFKAKGYHSITLNQLAAALYYGTPLPVHPIIFTFDDGYTDAYKFAYPILKAHNYSGVFYIITGKIGWDGQMNWPQLHSLLQNGMQIGSHTIDHAAMGQTYLYSPVEAKKELQDSQDLLQKNLHISIQHFCYPNGEPFKTGSAKLRQEVAALVQQTGYITATTDPGMTGTEQTTDIALSLLRIRVDGRETQAAFDDSMPW